MGERTRVKKFFLWRSEDTPTTCNACLACDGKVFTKEELGEAPPLHPNCKCEVMPLSRDDVAGATYMAFRVRCEFIPFTL